MEALDDTFKFLDARGDVGRRRYRAIDSDANDLDRRESNDRYDRYEWLEVQATLPRLEPSRGCAVERIAHGTAERIRRAIAINLVIAWRIMLMTLLGRQTPELPPEVLFSNIELQVLGAYAQKKT